MSARRNLRGYLREYGYESPPGLSVVARQGKQIDFYDALSDAKEEGIPTVFYRGSESEWLVCMKMSDFMEMYKCWEGEKNGL